MSKGNGFPIHLLAAAPALEAEYAFFMEDGSSIHIFRRSTGNVWRDAALCGGGKCDRKSPPSSIAFDTANARMVAKRLQDKGGDICVRCVAELYGEVI